MTASQSGRRQVHKADTVLRAGRRNNYKTIGCACMDDPRLSWASTGILIYLLTRPKNWKFWRTEIVRREKGGQRAVVSGLRELKAAGYVRVTRSNGTESGQFTWDWEISEYPKPEWEYHGKGHSGPTSGIPVCGIAGPGGPAAGGTIDGASKDGERTTISKDYSSKDLSSKDDNSKDTSKEQDHNKHPGLDQVEPGMVDRPRQHAGQVPEDQTAKTKENLRIGTSAYPNAGHSL